MAAPGLVVALLLAGQPAAGQKLTNPMRAEIIRGITAEFAMAKAVLPRSKKPLEFPAKGQYDKGAWQDTLQQNGPAARVGELIQVTKLEFEKDRLVLELNHGMSGGRRWWHNVQISGGTRASPVVLDQGVQAPGGTTLALVFEGPFPAMDSAEIKKLLKPVLDFEKRSATELYVDTLPKEIQEAIKEKKVLVGMDREMVLLARGRPDNKQRETVEGAEREDWIYGKPPGNIVFVTFEGDKVVQVKEMYAGLQ
jgi:hypothetical protein